jgi:hypothetical protein
LFVGFGWRILANVTSMCGRTSVVWRERMVDRRIAAKLALYAMYAEDLFDNPVKVSQAQKHGTLALIPF